MVRHSPPRIDLAAGLFLLGLAVVWGGSFFFAEVALREVPPLTIALHRVFWATPLLLAVVLVRGFAIPRSPRAWLCYLVMGALNNAIPFSLIFWGQTSIESGLASILNSMTAFFGVIVAGLLMTDERLTVNKVAGALLGVLGVAIIMGVDALLNIDPRNLAQLAILVAALSYAFASVWGRRFLADQPPLVNAFGMLLGSALLLIPVVLLVDGVPAVSLSTTTWASLIGIAIFSTAIAYLFYFEILARAGAANLMLVTLLIPPVAVGLGVTVLGESMSQAAYLGYGFIALGLLVTDGRLLRILRRK